MADTEEGGQKDIYFSPNPTSQTALCMNTHLQKISEALQLLKNMTLSTVSTAPSCFDVSVNIYTADMA